jgi:hypothetical protein
MPIRHSRPPVLIVKRARVQIIYLCNAAFSRESRLLRMVAQPRPQTRVKRRSIRLMQIKRRRPHKPIRADRLGKHRVHQYYVAGP